MNTIPETFDSLLDKQVKAIPVHVVEEDVLPRIPTQDNLVTCNGKMYPGFTCHAYMTPLTWNVAILTPLPQLELKSHLYTSS
jgi:hypothetical protein